MASKEPKAFEDIAEQFAPRRRPERFVWFHTTYDDPSLSVGRSTLMQVRQRRSTELLFLSTRSASLLQV